MFVWEKSVRIALLVAALVLFAFSGCKQNEGDVCETYPSGGSDCGEGLMCCGSRAGRRGVCQTECVAVAVDAGSGDDAGADVDSGMAEDAGADEDAGSEEDAGMADDAGSDEDAGPMVDAGSDAGVS